ncbi:hypothetical protein GF351_04650 [Candidatus Woesearchaeota archaeon]|nr:hypothetical protein [Candidatus Woesearchaeota archaeon]
MIGLVKFLDRYLGGLICLLLWPFSLLKFRRKEVRNILVIMFWGIGSNIAGLPAVKALKQRYPDAQITVLAPKKNKGIFYGLDPIDRKEFLDLNALNVLWFMLRNILRYDLAVDMEHYLNISAIIGFVTSREVIGFKNRLRRLLYSNSIRFDPSKHAVDNNLSLARLAGARPKKHALVKLHHKPEDCKAVERFLKKEGYRKRDLLVGICPGSGPTMTQRRWMPERFAQLADRIIDRYDGAVVFVGGPDEYELCSKIQVMMSNDSINSCGKVSLRQLIALIEKCRLFVSNDTGPMHIAAAQGVPTIGIFGPETPTIFGPYGEKHIAVYKGGECSPCIRIYEGRHVKCDNPVCMQAVSVEEVFRNVEKMMKR